MNSWNEIPLDDYERHMSDSSVGQLQLLNSLTKKYLDKLKPGTCVFLGIAGGNGLENINKEITHTVIGIDINQQYLDETNKRYREKIPGLQLVNFDINKPRTICQADFVWAALIMEYTGIGNCLRFAHNNLLPGGHCIVTIQVNNKVADVSPTGIDSLKKAGKIFTLVDREELLHKIDEMDFFLSEQEENFLPNGKSFQTFHFKKKQSHGKGQPDIQVKNERKY
jgi:hypothetical protein